MKMRDNVVGNFHLFILYNHNKNLHYDDDTIIIGSFSISSGGMGPYTEIRYTLVTRSEIGIDLYNYV